MVTGEVPGKWKKVNAMPIFKKENQGDYRHVSLPSIPGKIMGNILLEAVYRQMKEDMIWKSQKGFSKGKLPHQPDRLL